MIRRKYVPLRIVQPGMMIDQADVVIHEEANSIDVTLYRKIVDTKEDTLLY